MQLRLALPLDLTACVWLQVCSTMRSTLGCLIRLHYSLLSKEKSNPPVRQLGLRGDWLCCLENITHSSGTSLLQDREPYGAVMEEAALCPLPLYWEIFIFPLVAFCCVELQCLCWPLMNSSASFQFSKIPPWLPVGSSLTLARPLYSWTFDNKPTCSPQCGVTQY